MIARRIIIAGIWLNLIAINATAETTIIQPGPCSGSELYLVAKNSGALIKVDYTAETAANEHVIVFRPQQTQGWASQRLLRRFDLQLGDGGPRVVNTGGFCKRQ